MVTQNYRGFVVLQHASQVPKEENGIIYREKFNQWIQTKLLLKIVTKDEITIYGRMLTYHENEKMILVYDVDHKNVFNVSLFEIYQITPSE
ncbi:hypothetical protein J2Z37_004366 [Ammoniphilus resinae]|uniref:YolD-like family protein n=1 Tax=Ammoniphilus resinae TaxID=861532 RepID=A0ABS4GVS1_9BACL|nr:hypothetical protein [Ammoniphilus resinae]